LDHYYRGWLLTGTRIGIKKSKINRKEFGMAYSTIINAMIKQQAFAFQKIFGIRKGKFQSFLRIGERKIRY